MAKPVSTKSPVMKLPGRGLVKWSVLSPMLGRISKAAKVQVSVSDGDGQETADGGVHIKAKTE